MKFRGGYVPRFQGRPASTIEECPVPELLILPLATGAISYQPAVVSGQRVRFGDVLAVAEWSRRSGGKDEGLALPAPAAGRVTVENGDGGRPARLSLEVEDATVEPVGALLAEDERGESVARLRRRLARGGVWALFYESTSRGVPLLDAPPPKAIIVNAVKAEPFRARGNVVLSREKMRFFTGLGFLERVFEGHGRIHLILAEQHSRLAEEIKWALSGRAWVRPTFVSITYPVENERLLCAGLRRMERTLGPDDPIWVLDVQAVVAVARCLAEGIALGERLVALGGPACVRPRHLAVRIGTPVSEFLGNLGEEGSVRVLRGGLFTGRAVDPGRQVVEPNDDAFFLLPEQTERQFLGFLRPGVDRDSYAPVFLSALFGRRPRPTHTGLRGERRPCISCGFCEEVCPAGIMPHLIYRLLMLQEPLPSVAPAGGAAPSSTAQRSEAGLEEAQLLGAELCVNCGLCSYVCPSKLELAQEIQEGQERIQAELAVEVEG